MWESFKQKVSDAWNYPKYMLSTFGFIPLLILFLVYWAQGFKQFGGLAITLYYKDVLEIEASTLQMLYALTTIPWYIKPLYGIFSDNFPIWKYRRKSYLFLGGCLGIFAFLMLAMTKSIFMTVILIICSEVSQAVADVLADAIMVEISRKDPEKGSGALQSFCWFTLSIGGAIGAPAGGIALEYLHPQIVIGMISVCPFCIIIASISLSEERYLEGINCENIRLRFKNLCKTVAKPHIFRPLLYSIFASGLVPSFGSLMTYFLIDDLKFSTTFISLLSTIGYIGLALGSVCYYAFIKRWSFRISLATGQILMAIFGLLDIVLVMHLNRDVGISDEFVAVGGDVVQEAISFTFKNMPMLVLAARLCPEGVEATLFSLFMSAHNLGFVLSMIYGAQMMIWFGCDRDNYDDFYLLLMIKSISRLLVIPLVLLIPDKVEENNPDDEYLELEILQ